ncbi:hypothetical protein [Massilia genomosp. 1]|uniref:Uncharacterized protein n=1 Tax=Massilia genomosp. 1 TaxID=2609280 RepID=A0ABX0MJJ4_9BURK|nr:hypothetical protein [Massilia genomosp. 1]NHZ62217.1 hypothetical protein [Massilia genomosp. 1]
MMLIMTKLRPLPDLSKLSAAEKDRLILRLHARVRAEHAKLDAAESAHWRPDRPRFLAGEANKTPPAKPGDDSE